MARSSLWHLGLFLCVMVDVVSSVPSEERSMKTEKVTHLANANDRQVRGAKTPSTGVPRHRPSTYLSPTNASDIGCKELRSKRYVSDGQCTSVLPLTEVVCSGHCLPVRDLPWYSEVVKAWGMTSPFDWRCVDNVVRKRKVTLMCEDGTSRTYRVKVVRNCRCKQVSRQRGNNPSERPGHRGKKLPERHSQRGNNPSERPGQRGKKLPERPGQLGGNKQSKRPGQVGNNTSEGPDQRGINLSERPVQKDKSMSNQETPASKEKIQEPEQRTSDDA